MLGLKLCIRRSVRSIQCFLIQLGKVCRRMVMERACTVYCCWHLGIMSLPLAVCIFPLFLLTFVVIARSGDFLTCASLCIGLALFLLQTLFVLSVSCQHSGVGTNVTALPGNVACADITSKPAQLYCQQGRQYPPPISHILSRSLKASALAGHAASLKQVHIMLCRHVQVTADQRESPSSHHWCCT